MSDFTPAGQASFASAPEPTTLDDAIAAHDRQVAASGIALWMGAEPTFTNLLSHSAEWRTAALGSDKEDKARQFMRILAAETPGGVILRTLGRQYPGENRPRWNYGIYSRRDGSPVWNGPPDPVREMDRDIIARVHDPQRIPLNAVPRPSTAATAEIFDSGDDATRSAFLKAHELRAAVGLAFQAAGLHVQMDVPTDAWGVRLLFAEDAELLRADWHNDPPAARPPLHVQPIPPDGWHDELAARGIHRLIFGPCRTEFACDRHSVQVELPAFDNVGSWLRFLELFGHVAERVGLTTLVFTGFPPPIDESVAWTTVTPDPGVLEVNMAPCSTVGEFLLSQRKLHTAAGSIGLSSHQLLFNGEVVDSGGGQHLTFGGPSPAESPFLVRPHLLPRLVACLNHHPALSYWFAVRAVGSCGQQPRPDEVSPESLDGLSLALNRLFQKTTITPEMLWRSLAPFLCDRFGNTHRCEINVEKLWNPLNSERGCLGLVELRAFRMMRSAEDAAAVVVFLRTLIAWLQLSDGKPDIKEWGSQLHDRFSLPFYLQRDLRSLLAEMAEAGFRLEETVTERLLDDSLLVFGEHNLDGTWLTVRQAVEFWPVVGDLSAHDRSFRLMDSSTQRVEILLRHCTDGNPVDTSAPIAGWRLVFQGREIPWVIEQDAGQTVHLRGVRYKAFHPQLTVSPLADVIDPVEFFLTSLADMKSWRVRLFGWRPDGLAYDGSPGNVEESKRRRNERLVVERIEAAPAATALPPSALSECCVDLRRLDECV